MAIITLDIDDEIIRKVRRIAANRDTTVSHMVREFLMSAAEGSDAPSEQAAKLLEASFRSLGRDMGSRRWKREDLHGR